MAVRFEFDEERALAALEFLASKDLPDLTKWRICKLLFLADKLHLVRYGRPITGDTYFALQWGPVPSTTLDILDADHPIWIELVKHLRRIDGKYPRYSLRKGTAVDFESLSKSDVLVLNEVVKKYGKMSFDALSDFVHQHPAYRRAWQRRQGNRELMKFEEFFEGEPDVKAGAFDEMLENASIREVVEFDC